MSQQEIIHELSTRIKAMSIGFLDAQPELKDKPNVKLGLMAEALVFAAAQAWGSIFGGAESGLMEWPPGEDAVTQRGLADHFLKLVLENQAFYREFLKKEGIKTDGQEESS
jgi:hypothetical protein